MEFAFKRRQADDSSRTSLYVGGVAWVTPDANLRITKSGLA